MGEDIKNTGGMSEKRKDFVLSKTRENKLNKPPKKRSMLMAI
jgi:hypothetical protein